MSHICEQLVGALHYLEKNGMTVRELSALHHDSLKDRTVTFSQGIQYFSTNKEIRSRNRQYADRLNFVVAEHRSERKGFSVLVEKAIAKWPL